MHPTDTHQNLIPDCINPSPDYYCTWQVQLYATSDGKPDIQRHAINETSLFDKSKPFGWAYFYENARRDLIFVMDSSWDVPEDKPLELRGSHILNGEKFPSFAGDGISPSVSLKRLNSKMKEIGWKSLGGWVASQECKLFLKDGDIEGYWTERLKWANDAEISYWKVDNGRKRSDFAFRKLIAGLSHKYAPNLTLENACINDVIPYSDAFRTYDVPAIMSIPMTLEKIYNLRDIPAPSEGFSCLINCEDEAYIAAALGFTMGIMRHPYVGELPDGHADMSFPSCHRNIKTKLAEVIRAVHWHRIAPAYTFNTGFMKCSKDILTDTWDITNANDEIEAWWFDMDSVKNFISGNTLSKSAPAVICRNMELPTVTDSDGRYVPYVVSSKNPNGAISIATLGRTVGRTYMIPKCTVRIQSGSCKTFGVFGSYKNLILATDLDTLGIRVLAQDLADEVSYNITESINTANGEIIIPGDVIDRIGTLAQACGDTSESGMIIQII